jgi:hypothetical protein
MNFKKIIFFSAILCLSSVYSFGSLSDKSSNPKNENEPIFIYKSPVIGIKTAYSPKEVESLMNSYPFVQVLSIIMMGIITGSLFCRKQFLTTTIAHAVMLGFGVGGYLGNKKFHHEASQWLQELKEKELASKSKN